jgi:hypothetical protein
MDDGAHCVDNPNLGPSGTAYLNDLLAQYAILPESDTANANARNLAEIVKTRAAKGIASWADVHSLEIALIELWPIEQVQRYLSFLRDDLNKALGEVRYQAYLRSLSQNGTSSEDLIRADASQTLAYIYRIRNSAWAATRARMRALVWALAAFLGSTILLTSAGYTVYHFKGLHPAFFCLMIGLGALGGLVSVMLRIRAPTTDGLSSPEMLPAWPAALAPAIGMFASLFFFIVFRSGLLSGSLFPHFWPNDPWNLNPWVDGTDYAKLAIWGFISGFSETLFLRQVQWFTGTMPTSPSNKDTTQ